MSHQIRLTLDDSTYNKLIKARKKNYRTINEEINYRLANSFKETPEYPFTPAPSPIVFPGPGIPEEPYRITLTSDTTQPGPDLAPAPEPEVSKYIKDPEVVTFPPEPKYEPISEEKLERVKERLQPYKNTKHTIEDYEQCLTDPENKYYKKIKQYCINSCEEKEFLDILAHPDAAYIKKNYKSIIYAALEIPGTHDLSADEWDEIAGYFK